MLDISKLKRSPEVMLKSIKVKDNVIYNTKKVYVMFPNRFVDKSMVSLGNKSTVLGVFALLNEEQTHYSVSLIPARVTMYPNEIDTILVNNEEYTLLEVEKDSILIDTTILIQESDLVFDLYDMFMLKGKIPWYLTYEDVPIVFSNLPKYTGSKAGMNVLTYEILTAVISRDKDDLNIEFRNSKDISKYQPVFVGLENVWHSYKTTTSKLVGNYFKMATVSAINHKEEEVDKLESIIRA